MLERFERFTFKINEIQRCWNKIATDSMDFYGLKGSYCVYLIAMHRYSEGITASRLGSICGRDKADVSRAIAVMESKGLIRKEAGSSNLYRAKLILTEQGQEVTDGILAKAKMAESIAGEGLSDEQRDILYAALDRIAMNLSELSKTGIPAEEYDTTSDSGQGE